MALLVVTASNVTATVARFNHYTIVPEVYTLEVQNDIENMSGFNVVMDKSKTKAITEMVMFNSQMMFIYCLRKVALFLKSCVRNSLDVAAQLHETTQSSYHGVARREEATTRVLRND